MNKKYSRIDYPVLNELLYFKACSNGFEVYVIPKPGFAKSYACLGVKFGSMDTAFRSGKDSLKDVCYVPEGTAHFLEHKLFEQPDINVMQEFARLGASPNAYTSFDKTVYLFSCTDRFYESLELLLNYVQNPYFTDENVEKEKGIIEQEISMYADNSDWRLYFNLLKGLYYNCPVRLDIAGTKESIAQIDKKLLYSCHESNYTPENMALFVVGDVDVDKVMKLAETYYGNKESGMTCEHINTRPEPDDILSGYYVEKMDVSIPKILMGFKEPVGLETGSEKAEKQMLMNIILEMVMGESSDLYNELYEKGLINNSFEAEYSAGRGYAFTAFGGESEEPERLAEYVRRYLEKIFDAGPDADAFERVKRAGKGNFLTRLDSVYHISHEFVNHCFNDYLMFDYFDLYDKIQFSGAEKLFVKHFRPDMMSVSVIRPLNK